MFKEDSLIAGIAAFYTLLTWSFILTGSKNFSYILSSYLTLCFLAIASITAMIRLFINSKSTFISILCGIFGGGIGGSIILITHISHSIFLYNI